MRQHQTEQFFDNYAESFDSLQESDGNPISRFINRTFRKSMRLRYLRCLEECRPVQGKRIWDIGCGPGHYAVELARMGATLVCGIDFSSQMIELACSRAKAAKVMDRCDFLQESFESFHVDEPFDICIVMGFMDYVEEPKAVVSKVLLATKHKALFSFPVAHGFLAWQRRVRYRRKCPLYLYSHDEVRELFSDIPNGHVTIERLHRDFVVIVRK